MLYNDFPLQELWFSKISKKGEQKASHSEKAREFSYLKLPERRIREHQILLIFLNNAYILTQKSEGVSSLCGPCVKIFLSRLVKMNLPLIHRVRDVVNILPTIF